MKNIYIKITLVVSLFCGQIASAQTYTNNPISQYFRNGYLWNAAYAGAKETPSLYALINRSWIGFDGAPTLINLAGNFAISTNSGAGLQISTDKAGALQRMAARLNYSYKLLFSETEHLHLGIGINTYRERLNSDLVGSDPGAVDPVLKSFNEKSIYVDGEFGAVYENKHLSFGASFVNFRRSVQKEQNRPTDMPIMQMMGSYTIELENELNLRPLASFKHYINNKNLFAAGCELAYEKTFHVSLLYQNTGSILGGLGLSLKDVGEINFAYGSNNKNGYGQQYEVGLGVNLK